MKIGRRGHLEIEDAAYDIIMQLIKTRYLFGDGIVVAQMPMETIGPRICNLSAETR